MKNKKNLLGMLAILLAFALMTFAACENGTIAKAKAIENSLAYTVTHATHLENLETDSQVYEESGAAYNGSGTIKILVDGSWEIAGTLDSGKLTLSLPAISNPDAFENLTDTFYMSHITVLPEITQGYRAGFGLFDGSGQIGYLGLRNIQGMDNFRYIEYWNFDRVVNVTGSDTYPDNNYTVIENWSIVGIVGWNRILFSGGPGGTSGLKWVFSDDDS